MSSFNKKSSPLLNIQSEPDYSSQSEESDVSHHDNEDLYDKTSSKKATLNSKHNTFFSNLFKGEDKLHNYNEQDSDLLLRSVRPTNEAPKLFSTDINKIIEKDRHIAESNGHGNADLETGNRNENFSKKLHVINSEPSSVESNAESDTESMRVFRDNVHLLEEQPTSLNYVNSNITKDSFHPEVEDEREEQDYDEVDGTKESGTLNTERFAIKDIDKKQLTLWRFSNIDNLDSFFISFYKYYMKRGLYSFLAEKVLNVLILIFVLYLSLTLKFCINYSIFSHANKLEDIWIQNCFKSQVPTSLKLVLWVVGCFIVLKLKSVYKEFKSMQLMQNFYYYLLEIDDEELQIISWVEILNRLIKFKDSNNLFQSNQNITFENIVNRIMRIDNYLIAIYSNESLMKFKMFNNRYKVSLTKSLEWNINLIIINFFFQDNQFAMTSNNNLQKKTLLEIDLVNKFRAAGFINIILTPFLVIYFTLLYVFKYFYNIKSIFNLREYNLEDKYKLREYNELEHFFNKRLNLSIDLANEYLLQFPNNLNNLLFKFVAFISGSLLAVLTITTLLCDSENFLSFEISHNKSILFYMSIIGAINTFTYNNIQQDKYKTFQPKKYFRELSKYTHFIPSASSGSEGINSKGAKLTNQLSNTDVRNQFMNIYSLKLVNIVNEFTSLLLTPYILWFVIPKRCKNIIAFMFEITERDPSLGYICKYANYTPSQEEIKKSFFYMQNEYDSDNDEPSAHSDGSETDHWEKEEHDHGIPIDIHELKFDKKRRIKNRLLRKKENKPKSQSKPQNHVAATTNKSNRLNTYRAPYNLNYGNFSNSNDKMMRSFIQFNKVYHEKN